MYSDHDSATSLEKILFRTDVLTDNAFHHVIIFSILSKLGTCQHIYSIFESLDYADPDVI